MRRTDDVVRFLRETCARADRPEAPDGLPEEYGVFALTYLWMTLEEIARIADRYFEDPGWMSFFDVAFANKYRLAVDRPDAAPGPWRISFEVAERRQGRVIRDLLLGVNAHMSYDLVLTLVDDVLDDPARRYADYLAVNRVLADAIDPVQRALEARYGEWLFWADQIGGRIEEVLSIDTFVHLRQRSWDDAIAIQEGRLSKQELEERTTRKARMIAMLPF